MSGLDWFWTIFFLAVALDRYSRDSAKRTSQCPHCAERIMPEAKICPHCRTPLEEVVS